MSHCARLGFLAAVAWLCLEPSVSLAQGMGGPATPQARGPSYDPNKEFRAGIDALGAGKYRVAKENFEHVLDMVPDQPLALSMLAQSEMNLGDLRGAAHDFEASLKVAPQQIIPARDLAITDEKLGRHDEAMAQLEKLKSRAQACSDSCAEAGDLDGAIRDVEAAMAPAPAKASTG
jgi:tetratricopeptide (TPR) repeat protein